MKALGNGVLSHVNAVVKFLCLKDRKKSNSIGLLPKQFFFQSFKCILVTQQSQVLY